MPPPALPYGSADLDRRRVLDKVTGRIRCPVRGYDHLLKPPTRQEAGDTCPAHGIAIELATIHGISQFDPVFKRHCPLPTEVRKTYRAERTLRPSDIEAMLPIKFWEIDVSDDPQERWWAGCVNIEASKLHRPILEATEIELTVRIDPSRKMTVEAFISLLSQAFVDGVYVPDPPTAKGQLQQQLALCFDRLDHIRMLIYEVDRSDLLEHANMLQFRVESIHEQVAENERRGIHDPRRGLGADRNPAQDPRAALAT